MADIFGEIRKSMAHHERGPGKLYYLAVGFIALFALAVNSALLLAVILGIIWLWRAVM